MLEAEVSRVAELLATAAPGRQSSSVQRRVYGEASCWQIAQHDGVYLLNGSAWVERALDGNMLMMDEQGKTLVEFARFFSCVLF